MRDATGYEVVRRCTKQTVPDHVEFIVKQLFGYRNCIILAVPLHEADDFEIEFAPKHNFTLD